MNCVQLFSSHAISDEEFSSILSGVDANKSLLGNNISKFKLLVMPLRLIPCIDKPTRITSCSNTLIVNIYTNNIYHSINSGFIINNITDHLPVFIICPYHVQRLEIREHINVSKYSCKSILMPRNTLDHENWMSVFSTDNANTAFENVIDIFAMHYNNCCSLKRIKIKQ